MGHVITVEELDDERIGINANAATVEQSVHSRRKRQHVTHVIHTGMGCPKWPNVGTVN